VLRRSARAIAAAVLLYTSVQAAPARAQVPTLADGFEWGDTGGWHTTFPRRCDALDTFDRGLVPSRVLHVAVTGNDTTGEGTEPAPFATIGRAASEATPGTAIRLHAGTYAGGTYLADLVGTASEPLWIGGAPDEPRPLISGGGEGLHLVRAAYVVVHDLEVADAVSNGINADDGGDYGDPLASHHLVFRGLDIHDIGGTGNQDCLKLSGINDYVVLLSSFARCGGAGSGSGIDHVGCHRGLIARNRFAEHSGNAVQSKGGSEDIEIRWNRFAEAGARSLNLGGSTGFTYFRPPLSTTEPNAEARDLRVVANLFEGSDAPIAYVGCVGCVVANNTLVDPHNWILRILQETTTSPPYEFEACRDGVFTYNLVSFERADLSTWINIGPNTAPETFTFDHNLWYAWDNPSQSTPNLPVAETGGIYELDPGLDTSFHIGPSSPAAGAGVEPPFVTGDLDGVCFGQPPTIGAFETPRRLAVTPSAAHTGSWGLAVEVGSECTDTPTVTLSGQVVTGAEEFSACESITAGDGFQVAGSGTATLTAGRSIALGSGFSVATGGELVVALDPTMSRTAFVQHAMPVEATNLDVSFWIDLDGLAIPAIDEVELLVASSLDLGWRLRLLLRDGPETTLEVRDDSGSVHATAGVPVGPGWSSVAVSWEAAASASATLAINGGTAVYLTGLDTEDSRLHLVRLGAVGGMLENSSGTVHLDDITGWW
jgi:hypothetical protein